MIPAMHYKDRPISLDTPMRTDLFQSNEKVIETTMKQIALILHFLSSPDIFFPYLTIAVMGVLLKKFPLLSNLKWSYKKANRYLTQGQRAHCHRKALC